jgi:RimJ/RimL family protein N-acetyltransferase
LPEAKGEFNDFGLPPEDQAPIHEALSVGPLRNERNGQLIIERVADGQPIGTVGWHEVHYGPPPKSRAWNIGISLIPEARGKGYGTIAQRLLADYLFETTDVNRVEAGTDVENVAEQRSLEKAGFVREGIQRGAQFRAGAHHDLITYARLRADS